MIECKQLLFCLGNTRQRTSVWIHWVSANKWVRKWEGEENTTTADHSSPIFTICTTQKYTKKTSHEKKTNEYCPLNATESGGTRSHSCVPVWLQCSAEYRACHVAIWLKMAIIIIHHKVIKWSNKHFIGSIILFFFDFSKFVFLSHFYEREFLFCLLARSFPENGHTNIDKQSVLFVSSWKCLGRDGNAWHSVEYWRHDIHNLYSLVHQIIWLLLRYWVKGSEINILYLMKTSKVTRQNINLCSKVNSNLSMASLEITVFHYKSSYVLYFSDHKSTQEQKLCIWIYQIHFHYFFLHLHYTYLLSNATYILERLVVQRVRCSVL